MRKGILGGSNPYKWKIIMETIGTLFYSSNFIFKSKFVSKFIKLSKKATNYFFPSQEISNKAQEFAIEWKKKLFGDDAKTTKSTQLMLAFWK